jgi:hypothetical protein
MQNRLLSAVARVAVGLVCVAAGWAVGSGIGFVAGVLVDQVTTDSYASNVMIAVPVGGFVGALGGVWIGARLAPRVTSPWTERIGILAVVGVLFLAVFVIVPMARGLCLLSTADTFDSGQWLADDGDWPCGDRAGMVEELVGEVLRPGMGRAQVVELLGSPLAEPGIVSDPDSLVWKVRCQIDCEWLMVRVDDAGRLAKAELASD